jgi:ATP-binding cassette subfamily F protein 3
LGKAQADLTEINAQLGDPATYSDCSGDFIAKLNARREIVQARVDEMEEGWLELEMALED